MTEAIFERDGELFVPTDLARGPWSPQAQHGGPPAALLAHALETFEGGETMLVSRMTLELLRPVPIAPLRLQVAAVRPGRKVQLISASLFSGETEVARAVGLRIRNTELSVPAELIEADVPARPESGSSGIPPWAALADYRAFHSHGVEHRFVGGSFAQAGPATDWIRLRVPLVAGEATSPLSRVAAASDFGNGISWVLNRSDGYSFINPDLTIYLYRQPVGEWICLEAQTHVGSQGVGLAESALYDEHGVIGRALQSLLLERS